jgi:hypothetical protein
MWKNMRKPNIYALTTAIVILLLASYSISQALIVANVTMSSYGTIFATLAPLTAHPSYDYTMDSNSTAYYIIARNGSFMYNNAEANTALQHLGSYVNGSKSAYISCSMTTTATNRSFTFTDIVNASFTFSPTSLLTMGSGVGDAAPLTAVIFATTCRNITFYYPTINGLASTQGGTNRHPCGIIFSDCSDSVVIGANITNIRMHGFLVLSSRDGFNPVGIRDSNVTYCGWNGIVLGNGYGDNFTRNAYAINNSVSHCSDVGINSYTYGAQILNNTVFLMDGTTGYGGNAHWGIAIEGGAFHKIIDNVVYNCSFGITISPDPGGATVTPSHSILIKGNTIYNCREGIVNSGLNSASLTHGNVITLNNISTWSRGYKGYGIDNIAASNCIISFNTLTNLLADADMAMQLVTCTNMTVQSNTVTLNKIDSYNAAGVFVSNSNNSLVEDNTIVGYLGLNVNFGSYYTKFSGNTISNCNTTLYDGGVGTITNPTSSASYTLTVCNPHDGSAQGTYVYPISTQVTIALPSGGLLNVDGSSVTLTNNVYQLSMVQDHFVYVSGLKVSVVANA